MILFSDVASGIDIDGDLNVMDMVIFVKRIIPSNR